jgi:hypothetical protein
VKLRHRSLVRSIFGIRSNSPVRTGWRGGEEPILVRDLVDAKNASYLDFFVLSIFRFIYLYHVIISNPPPFKRRDVSQSDYPLDSSWHKVRI